MTASRSISRPTSRSVSPAAPAAGRWLPALAAGLLWLLAAGSATHWGLRWWGQGSPQALPGLPVAERGVDTRQVAAALGWRQASAAVPSAPTASTEGRFRLLGVIAGQRGRQGAALIAVGGQPPKPYRLGMAVGDEGLVLVSLGARSAGLGSARGQPATVMLELPALPTAAPGAAAQAVPAMPVPSVLSPGPVLQKAPAN